MKVRGQTIYPIKQRLNRLSKLMPNGCIEWQSAVRNGYGRLIIGSRTNGTRRSVTAHRLSYETYIGKIPDGLFVCHHCDNPKCINPKHLFVGTMKDNVDDRQAKGRNKPRVPFKLTAKQIIEIKNSNLSSRVLGKKYKVDHSTILKAKKSKSLPPATGGEDE